MKLKKKILNNEPIYFCSNQNDDFKILIEPLRKLIENNDYCLYSGNEGEDTINANDWKSKKAIFATPTIIYGIDSNHGFNVFGCYFNARHFDASDINQQLNRERKPSSIHIYMHDIQEENLTMKEAKESAKMNVEIKQNLKNLYLKEIKACKFLKNYIIYRQSHHLNIRYHVVDLLKEKGYNNISYVTDKVKIEKLMKRFYTTIFLQS